MSCPLWIDPSGSKTDRRNLFSADGEFMTAVAGLGRTTQLLGTLPDQLFLELYAYEVLERAREAADTEPQSAYSIPFWPECLFWAADVHAHPCGEIQSMLPKFEPVVVVDCDEDVIARAAEQVLGGRRIDPARYCERLLALAAREAWELHKP